MRVTWGWPGNSLERNWQLRPYIAATAGLPGHGPGGRGSDELRTPDLRAVRRAGDRGPVPSMSRLSGTRSPSARRPDAAGGDRSHPHAEPAAPARPALRQVGSPADRTANSAGRSPGHRAAREGLVAPPVV